MKLKIMTLLVATALLSGCGKVKQLAAGDARCDSDTSKQMITEVFSKAISDDATNRVKELIENENITIDMGKLRSTLNQITFNVNNVRTNNEDPNSKKVFCVTEFTVKIPDQLIKDADASRTVYGENNVAQDAVLSELNFELNQFKKELEYSVQPTDDKKKIYLALENADSLAAFVGDITVDALAKSARQTAVERAKQEELRQEAQEQADAQAYQNLLVAEAKTNLDTANKNLNQVWNSTTAQVRSQLLDEQRLWLKKRELECRIESAETDNPEVFALNCQTNMTNQRSRELANRIYYLQ
ncbi:lysozyme inhibitor LprI family protein [Acinetobacter rudis]|uniref:lysozyme inhibitor LprI family protein n=1 Tax=Acinetobacter rudis TaxID=632955 RepID=UPI0028105198|nr:lysozyme inhibitor LprI family protein [Acinetobacter rudis]MDQ8952726.1 lysozyme inhibitor LprI family protein [Acinetobacter rudis]